MKLTQSTETFKKFKDRVIKQELITQVEYDPYEMQVDEISVKLYQDGKFLAEISDLLDDAEGDLLSVHLDAINWHEIYVNTVESKTEIEYENLND